MLAALLGCSPAAYRASADRQVAKIVSERTTTTIGYQPQVLEPTQPPAGPAKSAYERVPTSPIAPATRPVVEPDYVEVTYEPAGPQMTWPANVDPPQADSDEVPLQPSIAADRLRVGPPAPQDPAVRLDLFGTLRYAIAHSRDYQSRMEDVYLAALDVTLERHLLSPRPFARQGLRYAGGQQDVDYRSALVATTTAGVRQRLPYGGEIVAETLVDFVSALSDSAESGEDASIVLRGSVPLLRGAGLVNLEGLVSSERELVYEIRAFEEYRRRFVVDVAGDYFDLLSAQQSVSNRRQNLANLRLLTARTRALHASGRISFLEVQRSAQSALQAESQLATQEVRYQTLLDGFKVQIGMPVEDALEVVPVALDVTVPDVADESVIKLAFQYRLDLRTAEDRIEDARRGVAIARNGLLPDLNLTAESDMGNREDTPARRVDGRSLTYSAGVELDVPIDRLQERNLYRSRLIGFERARRARERTRDSVAAEVRAAVRGIEQAQAQLAVQQRAIRLAGRRMEYANELLREGKVNARDVVEAQQGLLTAQDSFEQARAQLQSRVLEFLRATGTMRLDPRDGAIAQAMDRRAVLVKNQQSQ